MLPGATEEDLGGAPGLSGLEFANLGESLHSFFAKGEAKCGKL